MKPSFHLGIPGTSLPAHQDHCGRAACVCAHVHIPAPSRLVWHAPSTQAGQVGRPAVGARGPSPGPTCAAEGHGAHRGQVDGVSLVTREELQPHVADADEEEGAQG